MDHKRAAKIVIEAAGCDNLVAAAHCAMRLRLVLKDDNKVNMGILDGDPNIKGTFKTNGQFQVIIGPGDVDNAYDELVEMTGLPELSTDGLKKVIQKDQKLNPVMAFIKLLSDTLVPIIPALVIGGLLMALNNFLTSLGLLGTELVVQMALNAKGLSEIIQVMSAAPSILMPILVGMFVAKRLGANQSSGATTGMITTTSTLGGAGKYWDIFGLHAPQISYQYQVIPVLVTVWLLAFSEKRFYKWLPSAVDFTFTLLLPIMVTGFLTLTIIGPVLKGASDVITTAIAWLCNTTGAFGMGIFGLSYLAVVTTGLHQSFPAIETQPSVEHVRGRGPDDFIFVTACMANAAQGAATFAIYFLTKNEKVKGLASSSGVPTLLGITEPASFGVNLRYKFPSLCALIGTGVGAAFAGLIHVTAATPGSAGFLGFLSMAPKSIPIWALSVAISFIVTFTLTFVYDKHHFKENVVEESGAVESAGDQVAQQEKADQTTKEDKELHDEIIVAAVPSKAENSKDVKDPVFSTEAMGKGTVMVSSEGTVYSPVTGEITVAYETKHAYGIKPDEGTEVLICIGIDTVNIKGEGFTSDVKQSQHVEKGEKLGTVGLDAVKKAGYDTTVMTVTINTASYANVQHTDGVDKKHGDDLIAVTKR